jgi:predicted anti-sigma-YlaC factor YlaD
MNCEKVQKTLTDERALHAEDGRSEAVDSHLQECESCSRFAERLGHARQALQEHHVDVRPDAAFVARVVADLPQPSPVLGWAAVKLLPAAAALLLVLSTWAFLSTGTPTELVTASPTDDLVSWVLESGVDGGTGE